jgi:N-methylhydantoinase A
VNPGAVIVGVDIGGTFTDVVAADTRGNKFFSVKISTTGEPEEALEEGVRLAASHFGRPDILLHSGTIATNTLITRSNWPAVALLTTEGFRDVLEIGRMRRPELYSLKVRRPEQIVPRERRVTVRERTDSCGAVMLRPDDSELARAAETLRTFSPRTVVVSFINSYANSSNERYAAAFLKGLGFDAICSADVDPQPREFERTSTAVVNALLRPVVSAYVGKIAAFLQKEFASTRLYIMQSDGGLNSAEDVIARPVSTIESGPASGVVSALHLSRLTGVRNIITFDMGGTTAKAGVISGGEIALSYEFEAAGTTHSGRSIKGSGYPVRFPFIDLAETGAGGGSVAWLDEACTLHVGPESAGSHPGPACYGRGGTAPTVTDANLVLNRLPGDSLLGGAMPLSRQLAEKAISEKLGRRLGSSTDETALGILKIANVHMSKIIRIVSVERGLDPGKFSLLCFGGAGPLHGAELASDMGIKSLIVPENPGVFSALGLTVSDIKREYFAGVMRELGELRPDEIRAVFETLERSAKDEAERDFPEIGAFRFFRRAMLRYRGQEAEIAVTLPRAGRWWKNGSIGVKMASMFSSGHRRQYGYSSGDPVVFVSARITAVGVRNKAVVKTRKAGRREPAEDALAEWNKVRFGGTVRRTPVFLRDRLIPGNSFAGPALVTQYDTTTVVPPGWNCAIDPFRNIVLRRR